MKDFKVYQASGMLTELVKNASDVRKTEQTISGYIASFTANTQTPMKITVDIDSTGWTECNVYQSAHQYAQVIETAVTTNGITVTPNVGENSVSVNGTATAGSSNSILKYFTVDTETEVTIIGLPTLTGSSERRYYLWDSTAGAQIGANIMSSGEVRTIPANHSVTLGLWVKSGKSIDIVASPKIVDTYTGYQFSFPDEVGSVTDGTLTIDYDGSATLETGGQEYTLTSVSPIETLIGDNNIWADAGPVSVTYLI